MTRALGTPRSRRTARRSLRVGIAGTALGLGVALVSPAGTAQALAITHPGVVLADPANWTPDVVSSGSVRALAQSGGSMVAGGFFSEIRERGSLQRLTRHNLFSFDASTGRVDPNFRPNLDGMVRSIVPSGSGDSVFVGGAFKTVNGERRVSLVKLSLADGSIVSQFQVPRLDGRVFTMALTGGRLIIGGSFTHVAGKSIPLLAALDPVTGAVDSSFSASFAGTNNPANPGFRLIREMDVSPDGGRLVAIGNFMQVNDADRPQIVMFSLGSGAPQVVNWQTNRYRAPCEASYQSYLRDVDFAPDGSYFAVVTSGGGFTGRDQSIGCDSVARWQTDAKGHGLQPRWIDFTGNDTLLSVAVTGAAVYVGGHQRWVNNPFGSDFAGRGAVERRGLAALDPSSGNALAWNPGRTLGAGVYDFLVTSRGLWIGHDTNWVGGESHHKLALFPLA